jgi:hypothetical protein
MSGIVLLQSVGIRIVKMEKYLTKTQAYVLDRKHKERMRVSAQHRHHSGIDNKRDVHFVPQMHHILMRIAISANHVQRKVLGIKS